MIKIENIKENAYDFTMILVGNLILAFGAAYFIIPNEILSGGVAGVAIVLFPVFKVRPEIMINIILVITFILGLIFLGKQFAMKTLSSTILYPVFIYIFGLFTVETNMDPILASVYGGILTGVGLGMTFRVGASTGGMDIPPLILEKFSNIKVSVWIMIVDSIVIILGLGTYGINAVLVGFLSIFTARFAIDKVQLLGGEKSKQVFIITNYNHEVLHAIHMTINRGSTLIPVRGGYKNEDKEMIMTVMLDRQYHELEKLVKEIDPDAILIVSAVIEMQGPGFYKS